MSIFKKNLGVKNENSIELELHLDTEFTIDGNRKLEHNL